MPNIIVYTEEALASLQRQFPQLYSASEKALAGLAGGGTLYVLTGPHHEVKKASEHCNRNGIDHEVQ